MKLNTIQKLGGISLILGALSLLAYALLLMFVLPAGEMRRDPVTSILNPNWIGISLVAFIGVILMLFGLFAAYSRIFGDAGVTGLLGFIFVEIAYVLQACKVTWEVCLYPIFASQEAFAPLLRDFILARHPLVVAFRTTASATIFLGIVLFCLALFRSREFPKIAAVLIFAGAFAYALGPAVSIFVAIIGICVLSAGFLVLGIGLMRTAPAAQPLPEAARA